MKTARVLITAAVVVIALTVAVPLVCRLANALILPAIVAVVLYIALRVTRYYTE